MAGMPRGEICASKNIFKEIRRPVYRRFACQSDEDKIPIGYVCVCVSFITI
jgi:hypothetical protein